VQHITKSSQCHSQSVSYDTLVRLAILIFILTLTAQARAQWEIEDSHTTAGLRGIDSVGDGVAWASGTNGTILRTEDGGYVWQLCAIPPGAEKLDFRGIQAFDANTAIVMSSGKGDLSRLYKTTDGCQTWKLIFTNPDKDGFWDAIQFRDRSHGFLLGDPVGGLFALFVTSDAGSRWSRSKNGIHPQNGEGIFAASNSSLQLNHAGTDNILFVTGSPSYAFLYEVTISNGAGSPRCETTKEAFCSSWARIPLPLAASSPSTGAFSVAFRDASVGIAVGGDYRKLDEPSGTAAYTLLGALPLTSEASDSLPSPQPSFWHPSKKAPHGYRSAVAYDAQHKLWITVGPNGTDISRDDGRNWTALKPTKEDSPDADKNWNALSLPFVVGPNGRIGKLRPSALNP
jgi:photosystem II stability/assembly factor-like uncharacterized protein